ncbi:MAG TPA: NnrS family protein [Polyangiaceae bacterium]|nr:NnrS family protein [Polyangiaceae bacterium]
MSPLPLLGAPPARPIPAGGPLAAKGFRPFFLLAALFAAGILPVWLLSLSGLVRPDAYFDAFGWHAHEMVFGYAAAVIAGFLLTAAANWTSRETLVGPPLLACAALWAAGRVALVLPGLPRAVPAALDLAFLPMVAVAIARPILATKNHRNLVMVAALTAMWGGNLAMHLDVLGVLPHVPGLRARAALVGVDVVTALMVVMAGRIFPMFTKNATRVATIRSHPRLDAAALAAMVAVLAVDVAAPGGRVAAWIAGAAAIATAARAVHWGAQYTARVPLLWILHVTYAWIPAGLALRVAAWLTPAVPASLATHALTVGAIGGMTLGMMARVALGHTGRALEAGRAVAAAFVLVTLAALVRVGGPLALGAAHTRIALHVSGTLWTAAFVLFLVVYAPILARPRADGKPG